MFAIEEDLDKKLWLYAIHLGKDRSEVVNDLLRPIVASMVLYDSRDRRSGRSIEATPERGPDADADTSAMIIIAIEFPRFAIPRGWLADYS